MHRSVKTTSKIEVVDITREVESAVAESGVNEGICLVSVPHATAAVISGEFEPNLEKDYLRFFGELAPKSDYSHNSIDDNAEAHILSVLFGSGKCFPVLGGKLSLGTWQSIMLLEFDGPRKRAVEIVVK